MSIFGWFIVCSFPRSSAPLMRHVSSVDTHPGKSPGTPGLLEFHILIKSSFTSVQIQHLPNTLLASAAICSPKHDVVAFNILNILCNTKTEAVDRNLIKTGFPMVDLLS